MRKVLVGIGIFVCGFVAGYIAQAELGCGNIWDDGDDLWDDDFYDDTDDDDFEPDNDVDDDVADY